MALSRHEIRQKKEARAVLVEQMRVLLDGERTPETLASWDELDAETERLAGEIVREERQLDREADIAQSFDRRADLVGDTRSEDELESDRKTQAAAYTRWLRYGMSALEGEERKILQGLSFSMTPEMRALAPNVRAQSVGTGSEGGHTVPEDFARELEKALLDFGGMREVARAFATTTGANLPWPTTDDTGNKGEIIGENADANEQDVVFGQVVFGSYLYSSKMIKVPIQLLQDSAFNIDAHLREILSERIGRITNEHFTTGTGTGQPRGVMVASSAGKTLAGITGVTDDELTDLEHSVGAAYRRQDARWMFADSTLKIVKKLKDTENRPLWQPSLQIGVPDNLKGYPYTVNDDVPAIGALAKSISFGNHRKYIIRDVLGVSILRLAERFAEAHQVAFLAFSRHDGDLVDAGTGPVKHAVSQSA